jgi:hypothetical protein
VAPMITGMSKHFMFHIRWISILKFLYFIFSDSFSIILLSNGIVTSISIIISIIIYSVLACNLLFSCC